MRGFKSFLMSGMILCVMFLILQSTFFDDGIGVMNGMAQKIYSPFSFSTHSDAEGSAVTETPPEAPAPAADEPLPAPEPMPAPAPEPEAAPAQEPEAAPAQESAPADQAAAAPAAATPTPHAEEGKEEEIGFDTVDLAEPSGNWLAKRYFWEKAQSRYEQIKGAFDQILEMRMPYFKRRAEIDRQILEPLYISVGLDREEIASIIEEFNTLLSVDHEKHENLDEREKKMQISAIEDKKILEQLQNDVTQLAKYEKALDDFLDKLMEQVNTGRTYEKQAWESYKEIGKILNDKKARELWLGMDTPFKRLTDISQYIQGDFKQAFDKIDSTVQEHATKIKNALQSLKEHGVDLKQFSKQIDDKMRQEEAAAKAAKETPEKQEEAPEESGIMAMITSWFNTVVDSFYSIYESIMSYFTGSSESEVDAAAQTKPVHKKSAVKKEMEDVAPAAASEQPAKAPEEHAETPAAT